MLDFGWDRIVAKDPSYWTKTDFEERTPNYRPYFGQDCVVDRDLILKREHHFCEVNLKIQCSS